VAWSVLCDVNGYSKIAKRGENTLIEMAEEVGKTIQRL